MVKRARPDSAGLENQTANDEVLVRLRRILRRLILPPRTGHGGFGVGNEEWPFAPRTQPVVRKVAPPCRLQDGRKRGRASELGSNVSQVGSDRLDVYSQPLPKMAEARIRLAHERSENLDLPRSESGSRAWCLRFDTDGIHIAYSFSTPARCWHGHDRTRSVFVCNDLSA